MDACCNYSMKDSGASISFLRVSRKSCTKAITRSIQELKPMFFSIVLFYDKFKLAGPAPGT